MKYRSRLRRAAAVVALVIGLQSVVAAVSVLSGHVEPDYAVLRWLVIYNGVMGGLAMAVAVWLWRAGRLSLHAAGLMLATHGIVLVGLGLMRTVGETVATQSLVVMAFRVAVWAVVLALAVVAWRKKAGPIPSMLNGVHHRGSEDHCGQASTEQRRAGL